MCGLQSKLFLMDGCRWGALGILELTLSNPLILSLRKMRRGWRNQSHLAQGAQLGLLSPAPRSSQSRAATLSGHSCCWFVVLSRFTFLCGRGRIR